MSVSVPRREKFNDALLKTKIRNFKQSTNRENNSELDDFGSVLIAMAPAIISEISASPKKTRDKKEEAKTKMKLISLDPKDPQTRQENIQNLKEKITHLRDKEHRDTKDNYSKGTEQRPQSHV